MTTKTGEALRGRKRDPEVLAKAWATRRKNKRKAARVEMQRSAGGLMIPVKVPTPKRQSKASTGRKATRYPSNLEAAVNEIKQFAEKAREPIEQARNQAFNGAADNATEGLQSAAAMSSTSQADGANYNPASQGLAVTARVIMVEARKNNGANIESILRDAVHTARMEEQRCILEQAARQRREHLRVVSQKIVCGFLAEVEMSMAHSRGLPPDEVWTLNSFTLTKIVDALNAAGYRGNGFRDPVAR